MLGDVTKKCVMVMRIFAGGRNSHTRLCSTKNILTVNGKFPGPTLYLRKGETIIVNVYNKAAYNITIHWHGVNQPRNPWSDGPEFITQCPIRPGGKFTQKVIFTVEEGTLWWHAHSDWLRATVHGAIVIHPKEGSSYPFPKPDKEVPIILGRLTKQSLLFINTYTFKLKVEKGKTYMLRLINAVMQELMFFSVANHSLTVVASDASYTKPLMRDVITISPGQTIDVLLKANQEPGNYYMASHAYASAAGVLYDNTTTTAIVVYAGDYSPILPPLLPLLPYFNDTATSVSFTGSLRSLASKEYPVNVPKDITDKLIFVISMNLSPCPANRTCQGPFGYRLSASINNVSFVRPSIDVLQAYYYHINRVFGDNQPSFPPKTFNFTGDNSLFYPYNPKNGTMVKVLKFNSTVEIVLQGTNLLSGTDHPIHLHGYSFYVVGSGFGNYDPKKDPLGYNLVDPPLQNTIAVPKNGWTAIRFRADNPGVWFMHCHIESHQSWGMGTTFIVRDGKLPSSRMLPPPRDMPPC
ncbi:hypothetical protein MLD38_001366 [Melastoma candidum]|uniref:Uncharacterized protein n=1 Tax=Melastoma candidum TaxID=119954 RepID=A0ACB9SGY7_9MYRT|nr:hypothetical protein MLD38_001366 [Melastoma candidum]